jgi:hypothetical protein
VTYTPVTAASGVEQAFKLLEGRWKLVILFHLFGDKLLRFSDLERAISAISPKMLVQQLRQLEKDGIVRRIVHHQWPGRSPPAPPCRAPARRFAGAEAERRPGAAEGPGCAPSDRASPG